ncbi:PLDc N-terminal domain-containing protein [Leifsonia sp. EB34]|uniref:PLDc N-terminal domain-containing protein n=1 Tax=Leifsonia sp. EB34 TaxID=3156303 RepID=UPI003513BC2D
MELILFVLVGIVAMATIAVLFVVALVQVLRQRFISPLARLAWVVVLVALPVLGSIAWFAIGEKTPQLACPPHR